MTTHKPAVDTTIYEPNSHYQNATGLLIKALSIY